MAEYSVTFWLPIPPSANRLWRSIGRGRVILAADYKNWKKRAVESIHILQNLRNQPVLGTYELELKLSTKFVKKGDADNRLKAICDIANECKFIIDDKFCRRASVEWTTIDHDCLVTLTGEIAYKDQWEFAQATANRRAGLRNMDRGKMVVR